MPFPKCRYATAGRAHRGLKPTVILVRPDGTAYFTVSEKGRGEKILTWRLFTGAAIGQSVRLSHAPYSHPQRTPDDEPRAAARYARAAVAGGRQCQRQRKTVDEPDLD